MQIQQKNMREGSFPHLFKFNNKNTGKKCEICSKLKIKTPERHQ